MNWINEHEKKCPMPTFEIEKNKEEKRDMIIKDEKYKFKNLIFHHFNMDYVNDPYSKKKEFSVEEQIKNLKKEKMDINFNLFKLEKNYNKFKNDNNELEKEIEKVKKKINRDKSYIEIQLKEIKRLEEIISLNNEKNKNI